MWLIPASTATAVHVQSIYLENDDDENLSMKRTWKWSIINFEKLQLKTLINIESVECTFIFACSFSVIMTHLQQFFDTFSSKSNP